MAASSFYKTAHYSPASQERLPPRTCVRVNLLPRQLGSPVNEDAVASSEGLAVAWVVVAMMCFGTRG